MVVEPVGDADAATSVREVSPVSGIDLTFGPERMQSARKPRASD